MEDRDSAVAREIHAAFLRVAPDLGAQYVTWEELPETERRLAVRACWEALNTRGFLEAALIEVRDMDQVASALARERVIRASMAQTGESREIVTELVGALGSMDQEAVLSLTDGEPTTLRDGLQRYVNDLGLGDHHGVAGVIDHLAAMLEYPWPLGDGDPDPNRTMVRVLARWEGDYYRPDERFPMLKRWIGSGLDDRSDLVGWQIEEIPAATGTPKPVPAGGPAPSRTGTTTAGLDALVDALDASNGLPAPTPREFAQRVDEQLAQRGYAVIRNVKVLSYGIRPHLPRTPDQDAVQRRVYEAMPGISPEDFDRFRKDLEK